VVDLAKGLSRRVVGGGAFPPDVFARA
jgi:hypothetical protein